MRLLRKPCANEDSFAPNSKQSAVYRNLPFTEKHTNKSNVFLNHFVNC